MSEALRDPDLASQMAQLSDNLRALRPGLDRGPVDDARGRRAARLRRRRRGASPSSPTWRRSSSRCRRTTPGSTLDDVDVEALERHLGARRRRRLRGAARARARARAAGLPAPRRRRAAADPAGGAAARARPRCAGSSPSSRRPAPATTTTTARGAADEPTGLTRPWEFGDELPIDAVRTVANALRRAGAGHRRVPARCVEDFEVAETERRTTAAVALCVDLSFSMVQDGRWGPMKQTALALSHLIATRFRQDALQIIGFNRLARRLTPGAARRGRAGVGAGHEPAARADARRPAPAPAPGRRAGRAGRHRRRADRPPAAGRRAVLPLADHPRDAARDRRRRSTS